MKICVAKKVIKKRYRLICSFCTPSHSCVCVYLELLFLTVLAFPNASRTGFDCVTKEKFKRNYKIKQKEQNDLLPELVVQLFFLQYQSDHLSRQDISSASL